MPELVNLKALLPNSIIDLRYATSDNIARKQLYDSDQALLQPKAALALRAVVSDLTDQGLRLVVWDSYRSVAVQTALRKLVSQDDRYVLPEAESMHCRGLAIDVTLASIDGSYLDMGTGFDDFTERAHSNASDISELQRTNRTMLTAVMAAHDFRQWPYEWWHFDFLAADVATPVS